jgi:hypothetical protein
LILKPAALMLVTGSAPPNIATDTHDPTGDGISVELLFDRQGRFSGMIDLHESREMILQKVRRIAATPQ